MKLELITIASLPRLLLEKPHDFDEVADTKASGMATSLFYKEECPPLVVHRHPTKGSHSPVKIFQGLSEITWNSGNLHVHHLSSLAPHHPPPVAFEQ
jgi:hypothetical protein